MNDNKDNYNDNDSSIEFDSILDIDNFREETEETEETGRTGTEYTQILKQLDKIETQLVINNNSVLLAENVSQNTATNSILIMLIIITIFDIVIRFLLHWFE